MKKFLFTLGCLMAVTLVQAQTLVTQFNADYLNHVFNLSNKAIFAMESEEANEIVFYDSKFNIIKSLAYIGDEYTSEKTEIWERKCTGVAYYENEIYGDILAVDINTPIDSIIKLMGFENYIQENKGDTICIYDAYSYNFYEYDTYGSKYPCIVTYIWKSNEVYFSKCERDYYILYQGDWEITSTTDVNNRIEIIGFDYFDINKSTRFEYEDFTADVFDNDVNTIEYFVPIYELKEERYSPYNERDCDGDGEIDYKERVYYAEIIGYDLYSDGIKICRIDVPIFNIYIADGEIYFTQLETNNENDEYTYTIYIYRYDKQTNAIEQIQEFKSSTIRKNNDIVEIDLGQECDNKCEIIVTSVAGEQCARKQVAAGTRVVNIDTRGFANGIYNFSIMDNGKVVNNGKIIIR